MSRKPPQWGVVRVYDVRTGIGWIHYAHKEKNLRFTVADLRGIDKPAPGQHVAFCRRGDRASQVRPWQPKQATQRQDADADGGLPAA
jgi:hypothetical protein